MRSPLVKTFFFLIAMPSHWLLAQSPSASFTIPANVCLIQNIPINNTSTNATSFIWDFCNQDLASTPSVSLSTSLPTSGSFFYHSVRIVYDSGTWIGFCTDMNGVKLYRLNFGTSLSNKPTVVNLGNLSGFSSPASIDLIQANGIWYAFVLNLFGNSLVRVRFDNGLMSAPTLSENLGNVSGLFSNPSGIKMIYLSGNYYAYVTNLSSSLITIINFGNSPINSPVNTMSSSQALDTPYGISLITQGGSLYGLVGSFSSSKSFKLNFGANPLSDPAITQINGVPQGADVQLALEGSEYYGVVRSQTAGIYTIDLGTDLSLSRATVKGIGTLSVLYNTSRSISIVYDAPGWKAFTMDATTGNLYNVRFLADCSAQVSSNTSTVKNPENISYTASGNYVIELTAIGTQNRSLTSQAIAISASSAPDISFSSQNICANNNVNFTAQNTSANITFYTWTFGDGGSSSSSNPSHIYASASTYPVSLNVTASNGCQNFSQKSLQIFNQPTASFSLPVTSPICSNQNYTFTNTSTFDVGSNPTWQWKVNGAKVSTTQNLNYLISSTNAQAITLTDSIPGCSTQSSKTITIIQPGPLVSFTAPATGCMSTAESFVNTTSGSVTSYSWTFGDGNTSSQTNPSNAFANTGPYLVTLTAANAAGCQNSFSQNIAIYSNPQPAFAIELPPFSCANSPAQFDNTTPALVDSNIATWAWTFGDAASGTSNQKSPAYTYSSAANYNVSLQATTNFGCTGSVQKSVAILPSPQAAFTTNPVCVNQNTQFTDASAGSITNYQWAVQGTLLSGNIPPPYIFKSAGPYPVTLTAYGSNGCNNQITKSLVVPVPPVVDFTVQTPCAGKPAIFQELNPGGADPSTAWNWSFGSNQGSGTGSPVTYTFSTSNGYSVTLSTTRQSGCVYSTSKNITVYTAPTARFTPSVQAGAAPLNVAFNNTSSAADSSFWQFGDAGKSTSKVSSPTFTYTQLGKYKALLMAVNYNGAYSCPDTVSIEISVVIPHIDLAMKNFSLTKDPSINSSKATITISNLGNIPFTNPEVDIDLGGGALLKGNLTGIVQPGQSVVQTLGLEIVPQAISYICANVVVANDANSANDKQCLTLTGEDITFSPYPNPVVGSVNFDWVSSSSENVTVTIYESTGQPVFEQIFHNVPLGLGQLSISTSSLANGLYLIRFSSAAMQKTFRMVVAN